MASFPQRTHTKSYPHLLQQTNREKPAKLVQADGLSHTKWRLQHICFGECLDLRGTLCFIQKGQQHAARCMKIMLNFTKKKHTHKHTHTQFQVSLHCLYRTFSHQVVFIANDGTVNFYSTSAKLQIQLLSSSKPGNSSGIAGSCSLHSDMLPYQCFGELNCVTSHENIILFYLGYAKVILLLFFHSP